MTEELLRVLPAGIRVDYDKRLRELDVGELSGQVWVEVKKRLRETDTSFDQVCADSGESMREFNARVESFYRDLIELFMVSPTQGNFPSMPKRCTRIAVFTHGGWIKSLMHLLHDELKFEIEGDEPHTFPKNGSLYEFQIVQDDNSPEDYELHGKITNINDVSHQAGMWKRIANEFSVETTPNASPKLLRKVRQQQNASRKASIVAQKPVDDANLHVHSPPMQRIRSLGW